MGEIVQYRNYINQTALTGLKAGGMDLFMLLCSFAKDKGTDLLSFDYAVIKKHTGLSHQDKRYVSTQLGKACDIINTLRFNALNEKTGACDYVTLFPTCRNDPEAETITIRVNPDAKTLLNDITKNFTLFELSEFVRLESKYAKNLYRLLKQYRKSGVYKVEAGKFRELMDCPESYQNKEFMRRCVNPAVKELSQGYFKDLKVEPIRAAKRGAPLAAYEFTFRKSDQIPGQMNIEDIAADPAQEKPKKPRAKKQQTGNKFNNFEQRQYDYAGLESDLLNATIKKNELPNENS